MGRPLARHAGLHGCLLNSGFELELDARVFSLLPREVISQRSLGASVLEPNLQLPWLFPFQSSQEYKLRCLLQEYHRMERWLY